MVSKAAAHTTSPVSAKRAASAINSNTNLSVASRCRIISIPEFSMDLPRQPGDTPCLKLGARPVFRHRR
jgi:hypothetical protein